MSSGADLFVVCKQCGSEVSPYITECPYCGHRLRRRAPKLPRAHAPAKTARSRRRLGSLLAPARLLAGPRRRRATSEYPAPWSSHRPYAAIALVAAGCACWIADRAEPEINSKLAIAGPLHGDWWRLFTSQFVYTNGIYAFAALLAVGLFGWLLESRHGAAVVLALFFGAGAAGGLVAGGVYDFPVVTGADSGALALLGAWVAPELRSRRRNPYDDADLLGAATIAAVLIAMPFAVRSASWLAGVCGAAVGLLVGLGLHRMQETEL
jgi:membrane associated rhomboid family serine protease